MTLLGGPATTQVDPGCDLVKSQEAELHALVAPASRRRVVQ